MKTLSLLSLFAFAAGGVLPAQEPMAPPPPPPGNEIAYAATGAANFSPSQLDQLLAPIALYPDPLIALMLPASTDFGELTQAAQFLATGGTTVQVDLQPWDDSIRSLAHYPQIVRWMADNPAWTQQLGEAFAAQPDNVMAAIQRLRAQARAAGTLVDSPQQRVIYEGDTIAIEPADPSVIYVPYYDPAMVYGAGPAYSSYDYFSYSPAFATGLWLTFGLDWHRHHVWQVDRGDRERWWREHHNDWNRPRPTGHPMQTDTHPWQPRRDFSRTPRPNPAPHAPGPGAHRPDDRRDERRPDERGGDRRTHDGHDASSQSPTSTHLQTSPESSPRRPVTSSVAASSPTPTLPLAPVRTIPEASVPATSAPQPTRHRDHGASRIGNDRFPATVNTSPTPPAPTPSAALPGHTSVTPTFAATVPTMHPVAGTPTPATAPRYTPAPGYTPPARTAPPAYPPPSNPISTPAPAPNNAPPQRGGWQHTAPSAPPDHHAAPPPPAPAPTPQQQSSPPPTSGDGRHDRGRDQDR